MNRNVTKLCVLVSACVIAANAAFLFACGPDVHALLGLGFGVTGVASGLLALRSRRFRNGGAR